MSIPIIIEGLWRIYRYYNHPLSKLFRRPRKIYGMSCKSYEDENYYISILERRQTFPRICAKYLHGDILTILHPLLLCTPTYHPPLLIYMYVKNPLEPKKVGKKTRTLRRIYPTAIDALIKIPFRSDLEEIIVVDGKETRYHNLILCPTEWGIYISNSNRVAIYVGRR